MRSLRGFMRRSSLRSHATQGARPCSGADTAVDRICEVIEGLGGSLVENEYERQFAQGHQYASLTMVIRLPLKVSVRQLMAALETVSGLDRARTTSLH